jgi:DtxR family Mn-dependent transcriptional regulator
MRHRHREGNSEGSSEGRSLEDQHRLEEYLETLWNMKEQGKDGVENLHAELGESEGAHVLLSLMENRWIRMEGGSFHFEPEGERKAREIIRRHRLAERLLHDVLEMSSEQFEEDACRFEHILSPDVTESICTFLGHPQTCPHGRPIPPGDCCQRFTKEVTPLVRPLNDLGVGEQGTITFITPRYRSRLHQLSSLGVIPGTMVRLQQRHPTCVIQVGESTIAMDRELSRNIFVRSRG